MNGIKIEKLRKAKKMTQEQLAEAVGVTRGIINRIEKMTYEPKIGLAQNIAKALGVELNEIV